MLEKLTLESFAPRVGETFRLDLDGQASLDLVLQSIAEVPVSGWQPPGPSSSREEMRLAAAGRPATTGAK